MLNPFTYIGNKISILKNKYKKNLVYNGKEKLNKITIFFILILNIIVFNVLTSGISFQTNFLNNPHTKYPYYCKSMFNSPNIDINSLYYYNTNNDFYNSKLSSVTDEIKRQELSSECNTLNNKIANLKAELNIKKLFDEQNFLTNLISKEEQKLNNFRNTYNTALFENIANVQNSDILNKKTEYNNITSVLERNKKQLEDLNNNFNNNEKIKSFNIYLNKNKDILNHNYETSINNYYLIKSFIQIIFSLPLLILAFILTRHYLRKDKYIHYVISKNILFVISLPIIYNLLIFAFNIFKIIYDLLPKTFLNFIVNIFYQYHLSFLLYYLLMGILIGIIGFIIVKIQRRSKNLEVKSKIAFDTLIERDCCFQCGKKVNYVFMNFCPYCKNELKSKCHSCGEETINKLNFCYKCGTLRNN